MRSGTMNTHKPLTFRYGKPCNGLAGWWGIERINGHTYGHGASHAQGLQTPAGLPALGCKTGCQLTGLLYPGNI